MVAFQGELGAFTHDAIYKLAGRRIPLLPLASFHDVFEALQTGKAGFAAVPIENTLHGSVHENYDHLLEFNFHVIGETSLRISHQLIALPGTRWRDVRRVFSHPVALNQCRMFFRKYPHLEAVPFYDTAGSVKMLREEQPAQAAAIASQTAAAIYGGAILRRGIEDDRRNFTRFFLLSKKNTVGKRTRAPWKTSLVFSMPNTPGSLFRAMACFALRDLNLTKIESRPLRGKPWEYLFYVDFWGAITDAAVRNALANLAELTDSLKVLGCYQPTP